jgi:hypothetical protein
MFSGLNWLARGTLGGPGMLGLNNFSAVAEVCASTLNVYSLRCAFDAIPVDGSGESRGKGARPAKLHIESYLLAFDRSGKRRNSSLVLQVSFQFIRGLPM